MRIGANVSAVASSSTLRCASSSSRLFLELCGHNGSDKNAAAAVVNFAVTRQRDWRLLPVHEVVGGDTLAAHENLGGP
jgi:hypothetical protein